MVLFSVLSLVLTTWDSLPFRSIQIPTCEPSLGTPLYHRMVQVFADRVLNSGSIDMLYEADDLVDRGILRKGFARFLWKLDGLDVRGLKNSPNMEPTKFEEILEELGVAIPLPLPSLDTFLDEHGTSNAPVAGMIGTPGDGVDGGKDLLVIMRLPQEADTKMRETLSSVRQPALSSGDVGGGSTRVRAVFEFDHAGAPHGLPERVLALSHKIGIFSPRARWRHGGLFILHQDSSGGASSMIVEYDKRLKTFNIEALGKTTPYIQAVQFVISAMFHVARDFPGASWTGWMECGMNHPGEKMYHLAPSTDNQARASILGCTAVSDIHVVSLQRPTEVSSSARRMYGALVDSSGDLPRCCLCWDSETAGIISQYVSR